MATIPRYTTTVIRPRTVAQTYNPAAVEIAGDTAKAIGAVADAGSTFIDKRVQANAAVWLNDAQISSQKTYLETSYAKQKENESKPFGFAAMIDKDFEKADQEAAKAAPTEEAKQLYLEASKKKRLALYVENLGWERKRHAEMMDAQIKKSGADLGQIAYQKALRGESLPRDLFRNADATTIAAGQVYAPEKVSELNQAIHDQINSDYVTGLIESDPNKALQYLGSARFKTPQEGADFNSAVDFVFEAEGGFVSNDGGKGPTLYGINSTANPEEFKAIQKTYQGGDQEAAKALAQTVYKQKYWDEIGADNLSGPMALVAFDGAVNQGSGFIKGAIDKASGDPNKLIELRRQRYQEIAKNDPSKAKYLDGWMSRLSDLEDQVNGGILPVDDVVKLKNQAESEIKRREAEAISQVAETRALADSRLDLILQKAETPDQFNQAQKEIDTASQALGEKWGNEALLKLEKKREAYIENRGDAARGALFASGQATLNPTNDKDKKAVNAYYKDMIAQPEMAQLEPGERNSAIVDMVSKARFVPETLKGEIEAAGTSQDPQTITQLADLVDKISVTSPQLLHMLGDDTKLKRIDMINDRINAGYDPKEAVKTVDDRLDPRNKAQEEAIETELKTLNKKRDFRMETVNNFTKITDFHSLRNEPVSQGQIDAATLDYKVAYEDAYRQTRDDGAARKAAQRSLSLYGRTEINPRSMITKFPIERYYGIENQSSEWIRAQAVKDVADIQKNNLSPIASEDLEKNLYIVADPDMTPRSAAEGSPVYRLVYLKDRVPVDVLGGKFWRPDVDRRRQELVTEKPQQEGFGYNAGH